MQFYVDGNPVGPEDTAPPFAANWDTRVIPNGAHTLTARARDTDNKTTLSALVNVTVANSDYFQNQVLATGFDLPTNIEFLPDGRMLVAELAGKIKVLPPPYTTPDPRCSSRSPTSPPAVCSRGSTTSRWIPISPPTATTTSSNARDADGRSPVALHRQRRADRHGARERVVLYQDPGPPTSSTMAAPSHSATTASSTSRPASTSRGHPRRASAALAESSTASTRTGSCRSTTRSTTAPGPTGIGMGSRSSQPVPGTSTARPTGSSSVTSAVTSTTRSRRSTSAYAAPTTAGRTPKERAPRPAQAPLRVRSQRPECLHHGRVRVPRHPVPEHDEGNYFFAD